MKIFLLSLLVLLALVKNTVAQTYTIPWAQQQPAWVFPLWFEDASGAKDTLYIAYDPNSGDPFNADYDTIFGDAYLEVLDTSKFQAYYGCSLNPDLLVGNSICTTEDFLGVAICVWKCQLPLTIRWDVNLFRSSALPFPDLSPAPRAQGLMWFDLPMVSNPDCAYSVPVLITDSIGDLNATCSRADSIFFENVFGDNSSSYISFGISKWTGVWTSSAVDISISNLIIYPNPCEDLLYIKFINSSESLRFKIRDMNGLIIQTDILQNKKIDVRNINSGFYTIEFYNRANQKYYYNYFIKR